MTYKRQEWSDRTADVFSTIRRWFHRHFTPDGRQLARRLESCR